jgi:hypothetical protein
MARKRKRRPAGRLFIILMPLTSVALTGVRVVGVHQLLIRRIGLFRYRSDVPLGVARHNLALYLSGARGAACAGAATCHDDPVLLFNRDRLILPPPAKEQEEQEEQEQEKQ